VTHPQFKKISQRFKFEDMLSDTDCSEDYDQDMFFEGTDLRPIPTTKDLVNQ
jgi:hypothetical protein